MAKTFKTTLGLLLLISSPIALADTGWYAEGGYFQVSEDGEDVDAMSLTVGRDVAVVNGVGLALEISGGAGLGDDFREIDNYYSAALKLTTNITTGFNLFTDIGYMRVSGFRLNDDAVSWNIGAQAFFTHKLYGKISYMKITETNGWQVSVGTRF